MENLPIEFPDLTAEEIRDLYRTDPEAFMRLYRQVFDVQESLARYNINFFIQYVIRWEGRDEYVRQTPTHVDLQKHIDTYPQTLIWGAVGIGKAQPLYSKVLTPSGWKTIGEMEVGDDVVDPEGGVGKVTSLTPVEQRTVYMMRTQDGRVVHGADDHLWPVHFSYSTRAVNRPQLATTEKISEVYRNKVMQGKQPPALTYAADPHGVPPFYNPYLVGFMWSEVYSKDNHEFCCNLQVLNKLRGIVGDRCVSYLGADVYRFVGYAAALADSIRREWWLSADYKERILPKNILEWDLESRNEFLKGLTAGSGDDAGLNVLIKVHSKELADSLKKLAWSAGWSANHIQSRAYNKVSLRPPPSAHLDLVCYKHNNRSDSIYEMKNLGKQPVRCINVSTTNNTYITDDYIVTHNCVTKNTVFIDENKCPVRGEELYTEFMRGQPNKVLDFDMEEMRPRFVPVKHVGVNGEVPCQLMYTDNGHRLCVSQNHPVYVHQRGEPVFVDAGDVSNGDMAGTYNFKPDVPSRPYAGSEQVALGLVIGLAAAHLKKGGSAVRTGPKLYTTDLYRRLCLPKLMLERLKCHKDLLYKFGVLLSTSPRSVTTRGSGALLNRYMFGTKSGGPRVVKNAIHIRNTIEIPRGRRLAFTEKITDHRSYAVGLFLACADWYEHAAGVFQLRSTHQGCMTLKWAMYLAGVPARFHRVGKNMYMFLETPVAAAFLKSAALHLSGFDKTTLESISDRIVAARTEPLAVRRRKTGLGTHWNRNTWGKRRDDDTRGFRFSKVIHSRPTRPKLTYAVEVDSNQHTFITDGVFTHNTQQVSVARTLFWLGQNVNNRILIFMSSQDMAKDTLRQIKDYILNSPRYRRVFPHVQPGSKWSEYEILVKRQFESITPSIRVIGTSTLIDGSRYDKIIGDDALSLSNTQTAGERDKTHKWIETVPLSRMADNCQVVIIGNAYHKDDAMHRLEKLPGWKSKRYPARDPVTGQSLMVQIWPPERLALWQRTKSPSEVRRAIDVVPWTNESSKFKMEWFEDALTKGKGIHVEGGVPVHFRTHYDLSIEQERVRKLRVKDPNVPMPIEVVAGIDVGFGQTEASDETAIFCGVPFDNGELLVLYYAKGRFGEVEKFEHVYNLHTRFGAVIFVEANFTQDYFYNQLKASFPEAMILPWRTRGDGTVGNKWHTFYGVASLEFDFAKRKIILPCIPAQDGSNEIHPLIGDLVDGFLNYTPDKSEHTHDGIMAFWIMSQGARIRGGVEYLAGLVGRHGVDTDSIYAEYYEDLDEAPPASGIDASSIWNTVSPMLRAAGIPRRARREVAAEDIAYENFSGAESD